MEMPGSIEILLVEDSHPDAEMTIRTFKKNNFAHTLYWVKDGQEALDFLFCEGVYANRRGLAPPNAILLDLKMPRVNGIEVLRKVKADDKLSLVPIIIMTSSSEMPDIQEAYRLGVSCYVVKPIDFGAFVEMVANAGVVITHGATRRSIV